MANIRDLFDKWSSTYDGYLLKSPFYLKLVSKLIGGATIKPGARILDIGVGTGLIAGLILEMANCEVVGIDVSPNMLSKAKIKLEKYKDRVKLYEMNVCDLKLDPNSFDAAFASFAVHHVPNEMKTAAFKKIHDILKPSGTINFAEMVVDVDGDERNHERLKNIIDRWGNAALVALQYGGPEAALVELDAIKSVYKNDGEYLVTPSKWCGHLSSAGFKDVTSLKVNSKLGHFIFRGVKSSGP